MKIKQGFLLLILSIILLNPVFSQKHTVKLSPIIKLEKKVYFKKHLFSDNDGHYLLFAGRKGLKTTPVIKKFDSKFKPVMTKKFESSKKNIYDLGVNYYKDKFAWLFYEKNKKAKLHTIYATSISLKGKSDKVKKIAALKMDKGNPLTSVKQYMSDDTTKILIVAEYDRNKTKKNYHTYFCVLDNDLNKLWEKKFKLDVNQRKFDASSWGINNEGSVYFIGKEYESDRQKESKRDKKTKERVAAYTTSYFKFKDGNKDYTKISLDLKGSFIRDITIQNDIESNSIGAGIFSESTNGPILGTFYFKVNEADNSIAFKKKNTFTKKQIESFGKKYTSKDRKTKKIGLDGSFDMKDLLIHENGEFNVVLEDNFITVVSSGGRGVQTTTTFYHSNFIVYTTVNGQGEQTEAILVPKRQKFANSPLRGSHSRLITDDNIYFLYNDDIYNMKNMSKMKNPDRMRILSNMRKAVAVLAYFEDGKLVKKELFKAKKLKNSMLGQSGKQISPNEMIFFCVQGSMFTKPKFSMGTVSIN